ncbi:hypothetical protein ACH3XW_18205 [Acanthocheilonema viteae]
MRNKWDITEWHCEVHEDVGLCTVAVVWLLTGMVCLIGKGVEKEGVGNNSEEISRTKLYHQLRYVKSSSGDNKKEIWKIQRQTM